MLQIKDICKQYNTGGLIQKALDHVSFNLRDNEFVAVLGPSGSGKTTLLNIIGGLDRYDSGDLIINDVSTKKYKDRDWDSYRNHTIGFVFQSYNLIPHQTILANVELALTISGVSGKERRERALEALEKVGLREQSHKIPNQLSGGQMQRVAIARALVNDPDILLADEPTGALDSDTSLQVMDLLKEIAADRLVVMVTHNPELAERYATRIIQLKDGRIVSDSMPCETDDSKAEHRNLGKSSMNYLASLALSFNNLMTKKTRTILVAFAGSIGIIGIALILSLSYGGTQYIKTIESKTLSEYPITITSSGFDLGAMMGGNSSGEEVVEEEDMVRVRNVISGFFSGLRSNDLASLKHYFDSGESGIQNYTKAIEYTFDIEPQIYRMHNGNARRIHPSGAFSALGYDTSSMNSMMTAAFNTNIFHELPANEELYEPQYELLAGEWPDNSRECVLVLSFSNSVSDLLLYEIGLKDADELDEIMMKFANSEYTELEDLSTEYYVYDDFLGLEFRVVNSFDYYTYDPEYKVWKDKTEDKVYMRELVNQGQPLTIVGVVKPVDSDSAPILSSGINYHASLITYAEEQAAASEIIQAQLADNETNVFTGKAFGEDEDESGFDMASIIAINEDAIRNAFNFDYDPEDQDIFSGLDFSGFDLSGFDMSDMDFSSVEIPDIDLESMLRQLNIKVDEAGLRSLLTGLATDYSNYASQDAGSDFKRLPEGLASYFTEGDAGELISESMEQFLEENEEYFLTEEQLAEMNEAVISAYISFAEENSSPMSQEELQEKLREILENEELTEEEKAEAAAALIREATEVSPVNPELIREFLESEKGQQVLNDNAEKIREQLSQITISEEEVQDLAGKLQESYKKYAEENAYPDSDKIRDSLTRFFNEPGTRQNIQDGLMRVINVGEIGDQINSMVSEISDSVMGGIESQLTDLITKVIEMVSKVLATSISTQMTSLTDGLEEMFRIDPNAFADAITIKTSPEELRELLMSLMTKERATYTSNLKKLGYTDPDTPMSISIYPRGFDEKAEVVKILDRYNADMRESGDDDRVIVYTDIVGSLMTSVTKIIDIISKILIAFVAISLVVSSIMIGVITYISVLERKKEIGILRSIGASKRNIAQVFNAETFLIGLLAGLIGVGLTLLILIPANIIIHKLTGAYDFVAQLPAGSAGILILISIILTLIGGWIPSRKAAESDPVTALRTE